MFRSFCSQLWCARSLCSLLCSGHCVHNYTVVYLDLVHWCGQITVIFVLFWCVQVIVFVDLFRSLCSLISGSLCSLVCLGHCVHSCVQVIVVTDESGLLCSLCVQVFVFTGVFRSLCSLVCAGHCVHWHVQVIVFTGVFRSLCSLVCKWGYEVQGAEQHGWSNDFLKCVGLQELTENNYKRIGEWLVQQEVMSSNRDLVSQTFYKDFLVCVTAQDVPE